MDKASLHILHKMGREKESHLGTLILKFKEDELTLEFGRHKSWATIKMVHACRI